MKILTANSGSYPRVGDDPGQLRLRKAYRKWEVGDISDQELEEVYRDYTKEVIEEQEEAGLDVVTDGQLRWYDPLSHFAKGTEGCDIDGLLRYFDTNFYFRQPVIEQRLERSDSIVVDEFVTARKHASTTLKPVLTGPYTLARYSIDNHYGDLFELALEFADIIGSEIEELAEAGADEIQVDEPGILNNKEDFSIFSKAFKTLAKRSKDSQLDLYLYFGDSAPIYDDLQELPADMLALDFTYSPDLPKLVEDRRSDKPLGLGLIDARNTKMEKAEDIVPVIEKIVPYVDADKIYLNPTTGVEYLPRERAREKLENMVNIADRAKEVLR